MSWLRSARARLSTVGFQGPFYRGPLGKVRFVLESLVYRFEFVFVATPESSGATEPPAPSDLRVLEANSPAALVPFGEQFDREYHPNYSKTWTQPFAWGEVARLAVVQGRPVGIAWVQRGTAEGYPTYYGRLGPTDARILRVGVLPSARRQGVNTRMLRAVLDELFAEGRTRVFIECYARNVPSVRTFLRIGFTAIGLLRVISPPRLGPFVRWESPAKMADMLGRVEAAR